MVGSDGVKLAPSSPVSALAINYPGAERVSQNRKESAMHEPSVRVVRQSELSDKTPQTSGLLRQVAFDSRNPDAKVLSAVLPGAATGAHHHGDQETILYVLEGTARYRWGDRLQHVVEAGPGDFVFIPAHTPHQEVNAST